MYYLIFRMDGTANLTSGMLIFESECMWIDTIYCASIFIENEPLIFHKQQSRYKEFYVYVVLVYSFSFHRFVIKT